VELGVGFGLIVNAHQEHSIRAVEKRYCPVCGRADACLAPAAVIQPARTLTSQERLRLCVELEHEIRRKMIFGARAEMEGGSA
jgi:hypothetical protein